MNDRDEDRTDLTQLTGSIASAYVASNALATADLPKMVVDVHATLAGPFELPVSLTSRPTFRLHNFGDVGVRPEMPTRSVARRSSASSP